MQREPIYCLLVDDLEENLLALEGLLRRDGVVLLKAHSGPEALELLLNYEVALALIDVQMPVMDGFELAELMRGTLRTRTVPIIFLTAGSADQQRRFRGYEAGAVDFLGKPIEPDILRSKASVFFELHSQRQQVARLLAESQQYAEALKEADRRKDEFLATLAHELRNPLAPIRNGLQILRMDPNGEMAVEARAMMDRQLNHMVRLIDDLLDISRVTQGKIELRRETLNMQAVIQAALETSRPTIDARGHQFHLTMADTPIWVEGDMTRLSQIIGNLLNNAAKYTPSGGQIDVHAGSEDGQAVIVVRDTGMGIPSAMLERIFELFAQVEDNRNLAQGGLGIGLALVKHLVTMHDGSIHVISAGEGKGSCFILRLPLAVAPTEVDSMQPVKPEAETRPMRILVVDDNIASAKTTGWMLEMMGHQPQLAHDGEEAVQAADRFAPEVILLDIGLPGKDGYTVCRELRQDPRFRDTLIIAQTGWGQQRDREQTRAAGFDHHLTKPVELEQLKQLVAQYSAKQ